MGGQDVLRMPWIDFNLAAQSHDEGVDGPGHRSVPVTPNRPQNLIAQRHTALTFDEELKQL